MSFVPTFVDVTVTLLMAQIDYRYVISLVKVRVRIIQQFEEFLVLFAWLFVIIEELQDTFLYLYA